MRKKKGTMVIGLRPVLETLMSGHTVAKVYIQQRGVGDRMLLKELLAEVKSRGIPCVRVPLAYLKRLTPKNHQGVVALMSPIDFVDISNQVQGVYEAGKVPLFVLLDGVEDVRNLGAIARTALAMGVDGLVIPQVGSAMIGEDAMKTSAGALNHIAVSRVERMGACISYLKECGCQVLACDEKAEAPIAKADLQVPTALLFGGEGRGISKEYRKMADGSFLVPMQGAIASLNVSVAVGMVLYECVRQRGV